MKIRSARIAAAALGIAGAAASAAAQNGFDFVTVGAPGNAAYDRPSPYGNLMLGRGSVGYEYRIARTEVTTAQWLEFVNTYSVQPGAPRFTFGPTFWGAELDPGYSGPGRKYRLRDAPGAAMMPVGGMEWRDAAMFCNWLTNDKNPSMAALQNGAYDTSTFGTNPNGTFTDQLTHNPGATYWIPTIDEWFKAAHYDPHRYGPGQGGWWEYSHRSDKAPVPGPPGQGETSAGYQHPSIPGGEWDIPLGAYPGTLSPWGLLDASGGATEWTEGELEMTWRLADGHPAGWSFEPSLDLAAIVDTSWPSVAAAYGLRIASSVPSPPVLGILLVVPLMVPRRR